MARQSMREVSQFVDLFNCQSNAKPSEKDHDLPGTRTRDLWIGSQHTFPLHHLGRRIMILEIDI
jgi:hypothetical protein